MKYYCLHLMGILLLSFHLHTNAQTFTVTGRKVSVKTVDLNVEITLFSPQIVQVSKTLPDVNLFKTSLTVIKTPENFKFDVNGNAGFVTITTSKLVISVDLKTALVSFSDAKNNMLVKEDVTNLMFTPARDLDRNTFSVRQLFRLSAGEGIYGLGQDQKGVMNYRNHEVNLRQSNMYVANPFLLSTRGYGILWDNYSASVFRDSKNGALFESALGDCIDYYFVYGPTSDEVIRNYRDLTGQAPMFGKWAFGFWQCRERYSSQEEIVGIVKKFRILNIPLDNIVQDWRYWGETENWNSTEFGNPLFPDPKGMIDSIHLLNAHVMISVWPSFGMNTSIYKELKNNRMLFDFTTWPPEGGVRVYDPFNPAARDIYWKYINKNIFTLGMDAWWLDATEPEQGDRQEKIDSSKTYLGSFKQFRNAFPLMTNRGVYENQRKISSDKRVFILTRSAFTGQQRYASAVWSGDIDGNWDVFRKQISGGLNFCMSGMPYWTTDIGGFFVRNELYPNGVKDPAYQELYVRWFQFGTFCPLFRAHGTSTPREIFNFGSKGYWAYDVQEKFIHLRYRLLPYIYSLSHKVTTDGYTLMRGLPMDYPDNPNVLSINNQYMFGPAFLVCPVTEPLYTKESEDKTIHKVADFSIIQNTLNYLPESDEWFDFWTGEKIQGGKMLNRPAPVDIMPLYVKAGSVVPMGPVMQYASEKPVDPLELRIYTGKDASFDLYEDENDNYNYEKGCFAIIPIKWNEKKQTLTLEKRKGSFPGMSLERTFNIVFVSTDHGTGIDNEKQPDKIIHYSGENMLLKK